MMENDPYIGWIPEFDRMTQKLCIRRSIYAALEFGLGKGTGWLLEHFGRVHSIELMVTDLHQSWYNRTVQAFGNVERWTHQLHRCSDLLKQADEMARSGDYPSISFEPLSMRKHYKLTPHLVDVGMYDFVGFELDRIVKGAFDQQYYDVVFVDPGIHLRSTLVDICFQYNPLVIIADDIKEKHVYGYDRVKVPEGWSYIEYKRIGVWMPQELMEDLNEVDH